MITKTIEELSIVIKTGKTPSTSDKLNFEDGEYNWFTPGDFKTPKILKESKRKITDYAAKNNAVIYQPDTILITCIGDIGNAGIIKEESSANQQITGIVVNTDIIGPEFFLYWVKANKKRIQDEANQALLPIINNKGLKRIKVTFPSDLPTQNKIVALLDKASALVQKREKSIAQLDELLRAQFLEMFGDPVLNSKNWEINKLSKICNLERGRFSPRPRNDPSYFNGDYPFIQTGDISNSNFRLSEFTQTLNSKGIKVSKEFKIGAIVIAIVGATIGKTAILEIDTYATDSIIGITPKNNLCNNYFIELVLRFYKESLIDKAPSAARANINLKILNKLDIISPSLELQNKFETFNHRIESQKEILTLSKTELVNLYNSLLQDAFKGKLV